MDAKLIVVGGKANKAEIKLRLPAQIGRGKDVDLTVAHAMVSRFHCELFEVEGDVYVRDLKSTNGTLVNNERVNEALLPPGAQLTIGPLVFEIQYQASRPAGDVSTDLYTSASSNGQHTTEETIAMPGMDATLENVPAPELDLAPAEPELNLVPADEFKLDLAEEPKLEIDWMESSPAEPVAATPAPLESLEIEDEFSLAPLETAAAKSESPPPPPPAPAPARPTAPAPAAAKPAQSKPAPVKPAPAKPAPAAKGKPAAPKPKADDPLDLPDFEPVAPSGKDKKSAADDDMDDFFKSWSADIGK